METVTVTVLSSPTDVVPSSPSDVSATSPPPRVASTSSSLQLADDASADISTPERVMNPRNELLASNGATDSPTIAIVHSPAGDSIPKGIVADRARQLTSPQNSGVLLGGWSGVSPPGGGRPVAATAATATRPLPMNLSPGKATLITPAATRYPSPNTVTPHTAISRASDKNPPVCRICMSGDMSLPYMSRLNGTPSSSMSPSARERLVSLCHCKGTMGRFHRSCLENWLRTSGTRNCEICNYPFRLENQYPTFKNYVSQAWRGELEPSAGGGRSLFSDVLCFVFLTPVVLLSAAACLVSALRREAEAESDTFMAHMHHYLQPDVMVLLLLAGCLVVTYVLWFIITLIFHIQEFRKWRYNHPNLRVVESWTSSSEHPVTPLQRDLWPFWRQALFALRGGSVTPHPLSTALSPMGD